MSLWVRAWKGMGLWGHVSLLAILVFLGLIPEFYRSGLPQPGCAARISLGHWPVSYRIRGEQLLINPCPECLAQIRELKVDEKKANPGIHGALTVPRPEQSVMTLSVETWQGKRFSTQIEPNRCSSSGDAA